MTADVLERLLVARQDHPRVRHHGHIRQLVRGGEGLDSRDHRGVLGLVPLKRLDHQREATGIGEQPT